MLTLCPDKPSSPKLPAGPTSPCRANKRKKGDQINDLMHSNWILSGTILQNLTAWRHSRAGNAWNLIWMLLTSPSVQVPQVLLALHPSLLAPATNTVSLFICSVLKLSPVRLTHRRPHLPQRSQPAWRPRWPLRTREQDVNWNVKRFLVFYSK